MRNIFKPEQKEGMFTIPKWTKIAKTYNEAVEKALSVLAKERNFYNWREGKLNKDFLKETEKKKNLMKELYKQKGDYISFPAQLGEKYQGKSVEDARDLMEINEFGLGAYEMACILISHPNILTKNEDLWIDCVGDEYSPGADGQFVFAPYFGFFDGMVRFVARWVSDVSGHFGAASAFFPQSKIGSLNLDTFSLKDIKITIKGKNYKLYEENNPTIISQKIKEYEKHI
jgi:hypothetical protein